MHRKGPNKAIHRPDGTTVIRIRNRKGRIFNVVVDTAVYKRIARLRWCILVGHRMLYVVMSGHPQIFLHDVIAGRPVDHVDFDGLNNRRSNLRSANHNQQLVHRRKPQRYAGRPTSSIYKGVAWEKQKRMWGTRIQFGNYNKHVYFKREIDAAKAYDALALELHGAYAVLNFPKRSRRRDSWAA